MKGGYAIYYPHFRQCHSERSEESRERTAYLELADVLGILRFEVASPRFTTE